MATPSLSVSWQQILTQELYQSHSRYYCTTAHIKSSVHTLSLHRSTSCTPATYRLLACFCLLFILLRNSAHFCRCSTDTHHRKHMPRVRYPASLLARWLDLQKTRHVTSTHCCVTSQRNKETTVPVLLAMYVLRSLSSSGFTYHNTLQIFNEI
jgi:hypothetical protein